MKIPTTTINQINIRKIQFYCGEGWTIPYTSWKSHFPTRVGVIQRGLNERLGRLVEDWPSHLWQLMVMKLIRSGTNGKDTVEHIENFLKIVDPLDLPNDEFKNEWMDEWNKGIPWVPEEPCNWRNHIRWTYANANTDANYNPYLNVSRTFNHDVGRNDEEVREPNNDHGIDDFDNDLF
nr:hypothetical protein [Tanacetum cinerariifolium]